MHILLIHTEYKLKGGEDIVFAQEQQLLKNNGFSVATLLFNNNTYTAIKFIFLLFNPISFIRVLRKINSFKPDVIHIHNWFFGASPSIFIAARLKKIPVVYTLHNFRILCPSAVIFHKNKLYLKSINKIFPVQSIYDKVYKNSYFMTGWVLLCTRLHFYLNTWNNINKIICLTESAKKILCESYLKIDTNRIIVKPHFTTSFTNFISLKRSGHFLYVGRLSAEKGIDILLKSFSENGHKLKIIGTGPLMGAVTTYCEKYENIKFLNFKTPAEIREEMIACDAVIFPSICFEQFGLVIAEAFATGTAVISTNIGSPKDLVINEFNGLFFNAGCSEDLNNKITSWINRSDNCKAIFSKNAFDTYLKYYQPMSTLKTLNRIYKSFSKNL